MNEVIAFAFGFCCCGAWGATVILIVGWNHAANRKQENADESESESATQAKAGNRTGDTRVSTAHRSTAD